MSSPSASSNNNNNNPAPPPQVSSEQQPNSTKNENTGNAAVTSSNTDNSSGTATPTPTRKRTRATAEQLAVLEDTFAVNVSPNGKLRKQLSERLQMSERSIQIWFQNRRAKVKHMQKRAQMQMQQASLRAQMYQYQQYNAAVAAAAANGGAAGGAMMPPPPPPGYHQHHQQHHHPYYYSPRVPLPPRAQSAEASYIDHHHHHHRYHPQQQESVNPLSHSMHQQQQTSAPMMPANNQQAWQMGDAHYNAMANGTPATTTTSSSSNIPTLIPVPNAGPTAMLATGDLPSSSGNDGVHGSSLSSSPVVSDGSFWGASPDQHTVDPALAVRALSDPPIVTTIDPASIMMTPPDTMDHAGHVTTHLNATTLTIGTWQRLKLRANDLTCVYDGESKIFSWQIADNGCRFKIDMALDAVSSIEFVDNPSDVLADVHFDISEPPLFYMEQKKSNEQQQQEDEEKKQQQDNDKNNEKDWVQCSDFTEGKQASRFFRHSLKGVAHHLKQELVSLTENHPETQRLVRYASVNQQQQQEEHDFWLAAAIAAAATGGPSSAASSPPNASHHYGPASTLYWTPPDTAITSTTASAMPTMMPMTVEPSSLLG